MLPVGLVGKRSDQIHLGMVHCVVGMPEGITWLYDLENLEMAEGCSDRPPIASRCSSTGAMEP